jgi:hypothetical protein
MFLIGFSLLNDAILLPIFLQLSEQKALVGCFASNSLPQYLHLSLVILLVVDRDAQEEEQSGAFPNNLRVDIAQENNPYLSESLPPLVQNCQHQEAEGKNKFPSRRPHNFVNLFCVISYFLLCAKINFCPARIQPGGQAMWRPPRMWTCRCGTVSPPSAPLLMTSR